jgi:hypothetical protein
VRRRGLFLFAKFRRIKLRRERLNPAPAKAAAPFSHHLTFQILSGFSAAIAQHFILNGFLTKSSWDKSPRDKRLPCVCPRLKARARSLIFRLRQVRVLSFELSRARPA